MSNPGDLTSRDLGEDEDRHSIALIEDGRFCGSWHRRSGYKKAVEPSRPLLRLRISHKDNFNELHDQTKKIKRLTARVSTSRHSPIYP